MGYSINASTDGCYKGTTCLINKFDIKDEGLLNKIEAEITATKASYLEKNPLNANFDFEHYKAIHKFLFEDIYDWAGEIRKVNISKKGTNFVEHNDIENIAKACFDNLKSQKFYKGLPFDDFIDNIVDFYCTTNMLHPFREGNGRVQRIFISQLVRQCGYNINFSQLDTDELMIATIHSANGVTDHIKNIFKSIIK